MVSKAEQLYRNASRLDFREIDAEEEDVDELVSVGPSDAKEKAHRLTNVRPEASSIVSGLESVRTKLS